MNVVLHHHFEFLLIAVLLFSVVVVESKLHGVLVNKRACRGGPAHFNATGGTITSPLHPRGPPNQVSCSWILHNPHQDILVLSFSTFDLEQDTKCGKRSYECCPHQWLMIKTEPHNSLRIRREILHSEEKKKKKNKELNSHHKSTNKEHNQQDPFGGASSMERKWFRMFQDQLLNSTLEVLKSKTPHYHKNYSEISDHAPYGVTPSLLRKKGKTTGRVCGKSAPLPIITRDPRVTIKFYSDKMVEQGHLGFTLQYQIGNNLTVCNADEFMCSEPQFCIPKLWQCNGQVECPDSTDEADCQAGCAGLADSEHCDGRWHCSNGEDELGCFGCDADEWWCGEGTDCYKATRRCDGIPDCRNRADEVYCNCFNQTRCGPNSEFCYDPKTQRCDGILHCPNGNDEMDCGGHCRHMIPCSHGGVCYTSAQRCDGVSQCGDGSDEASCTPQLCHPQHGAFLCANHRCIRDTWRCDQFDDCGDASDEEDCLRNSVIVAAAMGGLVCSLLLVIAVGCTCRLYALRVGLSRYRQQNHRGGRRSTPLAPLSRLEQHLLQREPPPSYAVAVNDPSAALFGSRRLNRQWRRQRRRPPTPPEGILPPLPVPMRGRVAPGPPHPYDTGPGHPSNLRSYTGSNSGRRSSRSSDEKESEEEAKAMTPHPTPHTSAQHSLPVNTVDDDVPLLSAINGSIEERDDAPLLEVTSTSEDSGDEGVANEEDTSWLDVTSWSEASESQESELEGRGEETGVSSCNVAEELAVTSNQNLPTTSALTAEDLGNQDHLMLDFDGASSGMLESSSLVQEEVIPSCSTYDSMASDNLLRSDDSVHLITGSADTASLLGDVMSDTKAAVLALSVVQRHTDDVRQADTELTSQ